jgi:hypothetical protein
MKMAISKDTAANALKDIECDTRIALLPGEATALGLRSSIAMKNIVIVFVLAAAAHAHRKIITTILPYVFNQKKAEETWGRLANQGRGLLATR